MSDLLLLLLGCDPSLSVSIHVPPRASKLSLCLEFSHLLKGSLPHQGGRVSVGAAQTVPQCEVLAVVVVEEEVVVGVVGRAVDDAGQRVGHPVVAVVDGDGPDVDEDIECQVEHLVQREEEGVDVVGEPLHEAVHWVEGVAGKGRWDLPHVVGLVEELSKPGGRRSFINETLRQTLNWNTALNWLLLFPVFCRRRLESPVAVLAHYLLSKTQQYKTFAPSSSYF